MATMPVLRRNSKGTAVAKLQELVKGALGVGWVPEADGVGFFGPRTEFAVTEYQRSRGLAADGIVGSATWAALGYSSSDVSATGASGEALPSEEVPTIPTWVWFAVPLAGAAVFVFLTHRRWGR